jgi:hypothetical protein
LDGCLEVGGCVPADGCVGLFVGLALMAAALAAAWLVIEVVTPVLFLFLYWLIMKSVARVANDQHGCEGDLARSIGWGGMWATAYTVPLLLIVWAIHWIMKLRGAG